MTGGMNDSIWEYLNWLRDHLAEKRKKPISCWNCGSTEVDLIDSHWECSRPYKIYMCNKCGRMFTRYEDEIENDC